MKKKIRIGVSDFALPVPRRGSIDLYSGLYRGQEKGIALHQEIQHRLATRHSSYKSEVKTSYTFIYDDYEFEVVGRMDGVYQLENNIKIEEIKSSFNIHLLAKALNDALDYHPYCLQLKTYGYLHWLNTHEIPELAFHLISTRNSKSLDLNITLDPLHYENWLKLRLDELVAEVKVMERIGSRRLKTGKNMIFPFAKPRLGQLELINTVNDGLAASNPMLIQAPTGMGKTIGILFPVLQEAFKRKQKVIYVTPKNSQHAVAEDALARLTNAGANIKSLTLTAKSKMCFKNEPICNPEYCEFAKDHFTKIAMHNVEQKLMQKTRLTAYKIKLLAKKYEVCPYQLQFNAITKVDVVICDYHYVFSPQSSPQLLAKSVTEHGKPNLIIDEIHNLPARAMELFSPALSSRLLEAMADDFQNIPMSLKAEGRKLLNKAIAIIRHSNNRSEVPVKIDPPIYLFTEQEALLQDFLIRYLDSEVIIESDDPVMKLFHYWASFTEQLINAARPEFFTTYTPNPATINITCCDASALIKDCYKEFAQVVGFSATIKPFDYYATLTGLPTRKLLTAEFASPFAKNKRKIIIIPQVSTKFSERSRNYARIAEVINKIVSKRQGNYFVFFPSFDFLEKVVDIFIPPMNFRVLKQTKKMMKTEIDALIAGLQENGVSQLFFAVQGGVFSEGVDYPGNMIIGAFIVGPPLPNFNFENELKRDYYNKYFDNKGFDYTYTYPAMAKAVQAAGRVIRSEDDNGIIVLLDNRFVAPEYVKCMPVGWFDKNAYELVSGTILKEVEEFWESVDGAEKL
jgi:DNA excision repair protein ERCC-2